MDYTKAIELSPNYSVAYINRGKAKHFKGDNVKLKGEINSPFKIDNFDLSSILTAYDK